MTVKELRQLLKDSDLQERGLLSRLKRKQDLIDYLSHHLPQQDDQDEDSKINGDDLTSSNTDAPPPKRKTPLYMPPEEPASPKELLFEQLYQQYPPLREASGDDDSNDTVDIRQVYHPMLRYTTASDMDIVFVGTASCTPGTSRGVSCTALRLNWNRRCLPSNVAKSNSERPLEYTKFSGGTWLFDVGECTQVRMLGTLLFV